jgi:RimJ/RimL family protein N-acetyltransferase
MSWSVAPIAEEHIEGYWSAVDSVAREREYLAFVEGPPLEASRAFVLRNLRENRPHFVALHEGSVVGWCDIASLDRPVFAHSGVLGMGVVAAHRGRGIGGALIRAALGKAAATGLTRIELTVREPNLRARALYEKLGFAVEGVKRDAVRIDGRRENLVCMALLLDDAR